jgi:cobalt-zinc-cadmium efflux system protein
MGHSHQQNSRPASWGKRLFITMVMNLIIPAVQIVGGIISGSMALISDALHNLGDFVAVLISYLALQIGQRGATPSLTFGYRRIEVMAAVFNVALLFGAALFIAYEGWVRFNHPVAIQGSLVIGVALLGFFANAVSTWMLSSGAKENLNMRGAFLHMLTDALTSLGVALLGLVWIFRPWYWLDPIVSWIIVALILYNGWDILKEALLILMNATPPGISLEAIQKEVEAIEGISGLHHLHVWNPSSGTIALAAHVIVPDQMLGQVDVLSKQVRNLLLEKFNIDHPILQFETSAYQPTNLLCRLCDPES